MVCVVRFYFTGDLHFTSLQRFRAFNFNDAKLDHLKMSLININKIFWFQQNKSNLNVIQKR